MREALIQAARIRNTGGAAGRRRASARKRCAVCACAAGAGECVAHRPCVDRSPSHEHGLACNWRQAVAGWQVWAAGGPKSVLMRCHGGYARLLRANGGGGGRVMRGRMLEWAGARAVQRCAACRALAPQVWLFLPETLPRCVRPIHPA